MPNLLDSGARKWRGLAATIFALALAGVAFLPLNGPDEPWCPLRRWLGLPCLLCGGTRATQALLHGNWERALYLNGWAVLIVIFGAVLAFIFAVEALGGRRILGSFRISAWKIVGVVALLLLSWGIQIWSAVTTPKPELLNERSLPTAIHSWFSRTQAN